MAMVSAFISILLAGHFDDDVHDLLSRQCVAVQAQSVEVVVEEPATLKLKPCKRRDKRVPHVELSGE